MRNASRKLAALIAYLVLLCTGFVLAALPTAAQGLQFLPDKCIDQGKTSGPPSLDCILDTGISVGRVFFGLSGSFALLMFVIGGFYYVTSAGRDEYVKKGKEYIKNAVIGLVIVMTAAYFVEYGMQALRPTCTGRTYSDKHGISACCEEGKIVVVQTDDAGNKVEKCSSTNGDDACKALHDDSWSCVNITDRVGGGTGCGHNECLGANKADLNVLCCPTP